jgi:DNA gyrase subunit A
MSEEKKDNNLNNKIIEKKGVGKIVPTQISEEMKDSYLDYAMSVIVSRALPDIKDGLKPVQRRILYAMKDLNLTHRSSYSKSAKIVGETMGKYHPHGDAAIYDALVRMAQDFSLRYPLVDGHGNFGSIDGDSPAAMRYTEAKMEKISEEILQDINKETVPFIDNFDGSIQEPKYLPAKIPNLLLMGADGIAVGMATKIPPHNLTEVVNAIKLMINKGEVEKEIEEEYEKPEEIKAEKLVGEFDSEATFDELLEHIQGPDFPTGGEIYDWEQIKEAYTTGKGKIINRAKTEITEVKRHHKILVKELPYQVNKARLIKKIAKLVKEEKLKGISDIRDESDRRGLQIAIDLKSSARPKAVLNNLYKQTRLQKSFPANMVALVDGTPMRVNLKVILSEYIKHRQEVIVKRAQYELRGARRRAHILEGLKIALDNLDEIIETIKKSKDSTTARKNLMKKFELSKIQAEAILSMQLRRLSALERKKIEEEYEEIMKKIDSLVQLLNHPKEVLGVIEEELDEIKEEYGDERKTKLYKQSLDKFSQEDLVPKKKCLITTTETGYIKRLPVGTYRNQRRGGKGVLGMSTKAEDTIADIFAGTTHDRLLFFSDRGRVFEVKAFELPECTRRSKGQAIINLINIEQEENIQTVLNLNGKKDKKYLLVATKNGIVKKTRIEAFENIRSNGLIAVNLKKDDRLIAAMATSGDDNILLVTHNGKSIKFDEKDVRPMGRATTGVKGIDLKKGDYLVSAESIPSDIKPPEDKRRKFFNDLLVLMENGIGKRTKLKNYPIQNRAGVGVKVAKVTKKTGKVVEGLWVHQDIEEIILTSQKGQVIKLPLKNIPQLNRVTQGVILMRFKHDNDKVAAVTCIDAAKIESEDD